MLLLRAPWFRELVGGPECDAVSSPPDAPICRRLVDEMCLLAAAPAANGSPAAGTRFLYPAGHHRKGAALPDPRVSCNFGPVWLLSRLSAAIRLPQLAGSILIGADLRNNSPICSRASNPLPLIFDRFGLKRSRLCKTQAPTANHPG